MTELVSKVLQEAAKLPDNLQDEIAQQVLEDIQGELQWDGALSKSQDKLAKLADRALEEFKSGRTKKLGFDQL
jgi:hypothetical protein